MKNSYLISVLSTFSKKEVKEFRKWLSSPAHNLREDVEDLFSYLIASNHLDDEKYLDKERVYKKLFPKEPYNDDKLRQSIHFLTKAMEDFMAFQEWKSDDVNFNMTLSRIYRKRGLEKAFQKTIKTTQQRKEKSPLKNADHYWNEFVIQTELYSYQSSRVKRHSTFNFQEISDSLDISYIANKMKYLCIMIAQQAVARMEYDIEMIEEVVNHIEKKQLYCIPTIGIYYYAFKSIKVPDELSYYDKLKEQIHTNGGLFPADELNYIIRLALNYCIAKINKGYRNFRREAFEFQKMWIEKDLFLPENIIDPHFFKNIVTAGCLQGEFDWVESLIQDYQKYLPGAQREKMTHFSLASLHFLKNDQDKARDLLVQFDYDDPVLTAQAKSMLMRLYYEQDDLDLLESHLDSMRTYLHRHKGMGYGRDQFNSLIRFTRKLIRINPFNNSEKKKLEEEIKAAKNFAGRDWLLQKLAQL